MLKKAFYNRAWCIGWRFIDSCDEKIMESKQKFNIIMPTKYYWYADPFPLKKDNVNYIFVEIKDIRKSNGTIGVCTIEDGKSSDVVEVLSEPFHLSYPNVFEYDDDIYMIPETYQSNQIRLYKAVEFPLKWELDMVLKEDICVVDSSLLFGDKEIFMLTYDIKDNKYNTRTFLLDMKNKKLEERYFDKSLFTKNRPGGNFIKIKDTYYHGIQDCTDDYGQYLHLYRVDEISDEYFKEKEVLLIKSKDIQTDKKIDFTNIHTFNRVNNFETIDLLYSRFYITKPYLKLKEKLRKSNKR